ncbi:hypothetical protein GCM10008014_30260 [Paenibacillus silvae]|uniref:Uncharacterized protein n=1 Tax=Paenibacillus silvae TaxID=1325358 RepID=A0ABQ1ZCQ1_9BACL|nr:hypothetical protein GCM10008014_30260 [Paenibacillus silvae]
MIVFRDDTVFQNVLARQSEVKRSSAIKGRAKKTAKMLERVILYSVYNWD